MLHSPEHTNDFPKTHAQVMKSTSWVILSLHTAKIQMSQIRTYSEKVQLSKMPDHSQHPHDLKIRSGGWGFQRGHNRGNCVPEEKTRPLTVITNTQ